MRNHLFTIINSITIALEGDIVMHLRNGKVLGKVSSKPATMAELKKAPEYQSFDVSETPKKGARHGRVDRNPASDMLTDLAAPVPAHPLEDYIAQMGEELQRMKEENRRWREQVEQSVLQQQQHSAELRAYAPRLHKCEDGKTMSLFLDNYEMDCLEAKVPTSTWGVRIRGYLSDDALRYYMHMHRVGVDLRNWDTVREQLLNRFCKDTRASVLEQLSRIRWQGDHGAYAARFAEVVACSVSFSPEELTGFFLANLPEQLLRSLLQNGTKEFRDWEEAATALAKLEEPWSLANARVQRYRQSLQDVRSRSERRQAGRPSPGEGVQPPNSFRCKECQGVGHRELNCPLRQSGHIPKQGYTCRRCGGKDHFAKDCATKPYRPQSIGSPSRDPPTPIGAVPNRLNGVA